MCVFLLTVLCLVEKATNLVNVGALKNGFGDGFEGVERLAVQNDRRRGDAAPGGLVEFQRKLLLHKQGQHVAHLFIRQNTVVVGVEQLERQV